MRNPLHVLNITQNSKSNTARPNSNHIATSTFGIFIDPVTVCQNRIKMRKMNSELIIVRQIAGNVARKTY